MKAIHLGAAALNLTPKDWEGNTRTILACIAEAKARKVSVLCLPELAITGYGCEDEFHAPYVSEWALRILFEDIAPACRGITVGIGLPFCLDGCIYNGIAHVVDGAVVGVIAKQNLAGDGIHYEPRFFKPWPKGFVTDAVLHRHKIPVGDLIFDHAGIRIGYEICEDAWVANRPGARLAQNSVDLILNPSASHFAFGKAGVRERFVREGSRAFHCAYVYANLLGNEAGRAIYDGDCLIASGGRIFGRSERFAYADYVLNEAVVDLNPTRVQRHRQASHRPPLEAAMKSIPINWSPLLAIGEASAPAKAIGEPASRSKAIEFADAVALGLYDYLRKSKSSGFAISLSGGADSATCLALVYHMARQLVAHRPSNLPTAISALLDGASKDTQEATRQLVNHLCTCAYQGTENSGEATRAAARTLAEDAGARFFDINVQPLFEAYEKILSDYLGRPLSWETDDIPRQNIQARCRAPSIWAIANANNALLLSTSNRSEAAVGYCTMDGDTAGSISPIAGIDKAFLLEWLKWAETHLLRGLRTVNQLKPTAELRPSSAGQTDESDLMPYPVLNRIQKLAVVNKGSPREIFYQLRAELDAKFSSGQLFEWLSKYLQLWSRNQWKRERYAPSFHLDDENLDPRSWCRYPILSGGYHAELAALRKELEL